MEDLAGRTWGRFQIIEERGRGGMAVVYKAYDGVLQRTVALKVLLPHLVSDTGFIQRFHREAITAANLRHPNIVVIYDIGAHDDLQYIVMEYLIGQTLQQEIQQKGALSLARVLPILQQLASALDYAHEQGLVHRDVKPANIILDRHDHVTLTDFGLVKAIRGSETTSGGMAVGTLKYMAPEQAMGQELDRRSDIYSLGVVVYEMLTGEVPFSGTTPYQALQQLIHTPPLPLSRHSSLVNPKLERTVLRALSKDPHRRFATAGEFVRGLAAATDSEAAGEPRSQADLSRREVALRLTMPDGREFPVYRGETAIGRGVGNDVVLPVYAVSRHHARIRCGPEGCAVTDLGSTNGTFVNGVRLLAEAPTPLGPGDVLGIGPVNLLVVLPQTSSQQPEVETVNWEIR
jgi:serine/threonine protein kinase